MGWGLWLDGDCVFSYLVQVVLELLLGCDVGD